jgi:hypothetical protein
MPSQVSAMIIFHSATAEESEEEILDEQQTPDFASQGLLEIRKTITNLT